jgi:hypothetical protein
MNKTKGLLLTASLVLATTFTLSCSDDDGGGYKSCKELYEIFEWCDEHDDEYDDDDICIMEKACGGNDEATCGAHYKSECPEMFEDQY